MNDAERKLAKRLWAKALADGTGCWIWQAATTSNGYGRIGVAGGKWKRAHRVAYELVVGPIPEGLTIDHLCRNRACINPQHMEPVTLKQNVLRGRGVLGHSRKSECLRGHRYDEANTYRRPDGTRHCRACAQAAERRRRAVPKV